MPPPPPAPRPLVQLAQVEVAPPPPPKKPRHPATGTGPDPSGEDDRQRAAAWIGALADVMRRTAGELGRLQRLADGRRRAAEAYPPDPVGVPPHPAPRPARPTPALDGSAASLRSASPAPGPLGADEARPPAGESDDDVGFEELPDPFAPPPSPAAVVDGHRAAAERQRAHGSRATPTVPASNPAGRMEPMLVGQTGDVDPAEDIHRPRGYEAALPGAVQPPVDVRIELDDLKDADARVRLSAARSLRKRGERWPTVVRAWKAALRDDDAEVRGTAAQALADLDCHEAVAEVRRLLDDGSSWVRRQACEALARMGDLATLPRVLGFLQDVAGWVRSLCGGGKPEALRVLAEAQRVGGDAVRRAINGELGRVGVELRRSAAGVDEYRLRHERDWRPVPTPGQFTA